MRSMTADRAVRLLALPAVLLLALGAGTASAYVWEPETVDAAGNVAGWCTSLALDASGYPCIAYYDMKNFDLKYAYKATDGWHTRTVDAAGDVGSSTSLALDSLGNPRISYYDATNGDLKYAWWSRILGWHTESVDAAGDVGMDTSLALGADYPCISYWDFTNGDLKIAYKDSGGWHTETVDAEGRVGSSTSLALDGDGYPRISYYDSTNRDLKYAWRDDTRWHIETVDTEGNVGGGTSLALDAAGNPRISYIHNTNENLKYAWRDGAGWHLETADQGSCWGSDTSLVVDAAGTPRISYRDHEDIHLKYAWRDGTGWHAETADPGVTTGWSSSLALDAAGSPRISYYDSSNGDLRYARGAPVSIVTYEAEDFDNGGEGVGYHDTTPANEGGAYRPSEGVDIESLPGGGYTVAYIREGEWLRYTRSTWPAGARLLAFHVACWQSGRSIEVKVNDATVGTLAVPVSGSSTAYFSTSMVLPSAIPDGARLKLVFHGGSMNLDSFTLREAPVPTVSPTPVPTIGPVAVVPGAAGLPADTNDDGLYDDVNGNGRRDFADIVLYFNQMSWIAANEPVVCFDCNGNGRIDFADVVWLFNHL